jgi:acyl-CoA synthetase (AMP-forming)/AMP-acid ligase II
MSSPPENTEATLVATLLAHADRQPEAPALVCGDESLTWSALRTRVLGLAGRIIAEAPDGRGRVGLAGHNSIGLVVAYLATVAAGRCAVPLPISASPEALAGMLENADPDLVFADAERGALLSGRIDAGVFDADAPLDLAEATPLAEPRIPHADAPFNIIYSSGTTGRPKGIVHAFAMRHRQCARALFSLGPDSTMLLATPLYSNTTLMPMLAALFHGGRVVLMPKFDAEAYLDLAETMGATHTMLVPVQYERILGAASFDRRDLGTFKVKQCTGAPMSPATKHAAAERWPGRFLEIYGLTEGGCTVILDVGAHPDKAATVGRPAPGNDVRVIDEAGAVRPAGERGEVIGRSPTMMSGYFRNQEATDAFHFRDAEGHLFHRTGDIGVFDEDGFLRLVDRKKDVIISGGFNVYASDLEAELTAHPAVAEACVIAVPSDRWGETPLGLVVLKPGQQARPEEILAATNARLGRMQHLSAVEVRTSLPRSAVGKVLKQDLRRSYWPA